MTKTGVMICGHGSRSQAAVDEFAVLAEKLPALLPDDWMVDYGYLEFANPVIRDGLDKLREAGCERILAVPGMLFAAMHAKNDIPTVLNTYAAKHDMDIMFGRELGVDPKMIAAAAGRVRDAVDRANADLGEMALEDTALVVIGRGEPCLEHVTKLGYKRVIVFPYFLFTGILIDRIYGFTDRVAEANGSPSLWARCLRPIVEPANIARRFWRWKVGRLSR